MIPNLSSYLDLANHHANATASDIEAICNDVLTYHFNGAFVNPYYISLARSLLARQAKVGTAFSFPLGQDTLDMKVRSAVECVNLGADELDIVPNNALLITNEQDIYLNEMKRIVSAVRELGKGTIVKFILETGYFYPRKPEDMTPDLKTKGDELIRTGATLIKEADADFVKICSGMGLRGASLDDVRLVKEVVGDTMRIKVAGGIDTLTEAQSFIAAGANRIGTSKAVEIMKQTSP